MLIRLIRIAAVTLGATIVVALVACVAIWTRINLGTRDLRTGEIDSIRNARVAIVFGARVTRSGEPSSILRDRVDGAVALYKADKVQKILMSGDNRFVEYNEPQVMRDYAVSVGVLEEDIVMDYAGRSTYDTCWRAKNIFGLSEAVLVTQEYHAPRAAYTCNAQGVDSQVFAQPDFDKYPNLRWSYSVREYGADLKAWYEIRILQRKAEVAGAVEPAI